MNKVLKDAVKYSGDRISLENVSFENYVTTDNLLQNKQGKVSVESLPPNSVNVTKYEKGDILISNIRPYLKKIWYASHSGGSSADVLTLKVNKNFDSNFIYYTLFQDIFFEHMMNGSKGTKMPRGDKNQILDFPIPNFPIPTQKSIAKVLSDLDAKIELNNKINQELEAMAKTLYDYWFVQFDFPNEQGKPYKSSGGKMVYNQELKREIPEGWEDGVFEDIGTIVGGSTPSKAIATNFSVNNSTPWITPKDLSLNKGNKFITRGEFDVTEKGIRNASLKIMPKGTVLLSSRAPIGYLAISREFVTTNQGFKSFEPNKGFSTYFIYYTVKNMIPAIINNSVGSTFKEISGSTLKSIKISLPSKAILNLYDEKASSIFEKQNLIELENQQLAELRDWLLPMLMNGQVTVKEAQEKLDSSAEFNQNIAAELKEEYNRVIP